MSAFTITGYAFSGELERIADRAAYLGSGLLVILLAAFASYIGWKFYNRRRFLHGLKIARITPEELKSKIDAGEDVIIVDLRHALALRSTAGNDSRRIAHGRGRTRRSV